MKKQTFQPKSKSVTLAAVISFYQKNNHRVIQIKDRQGNCYSLKKLDLIVEK